MYPRQTKENPSYSQPPFAGGEEGRRDAGPVSACLAEYLASRATSPLTRVCPTNSSWTRRRTRWTCFIVLDAPHAGGRGKVIVFGKVGGHGPGKLREMRQNLALKTLARPNLPHADYLSHTYQRPRASLTASYNILLYHPSTILTVDSQVPLPNFRLSRMPYWTMYGCDQYHNQKLHSCFSSSQPHTSPHVRASSVTYMALELRGDCRICPLRPRREL